MSEELVQLKAEIYDLTKTLDVSQKNFMAILTEIVKKIPPIGECPKEETLVLILEAIKNLPDYEEVDAVTETLAELPDE